MTTDRDRSRTFTRRVILLGAGKVVLLSALTARLYQLQVLEADRFALLAERNRINAYPLLPPRGRILDRFGAPLAVNEPAYAVAVRREAVADPRASLRVLQSLVPLSGAGVELAIRRMAQQPPFIPVTVMEGLTWEQVAMIEINAPDLPGVDIEASQRRFQPAGAMAAHVVGYVGEASRTDLDAADREILPGSIVGKAGLERALDAELLGNGGVRYVEVNAAGRPMRELSRENPSPGHDVTTTLDLGLQTFVAERLSAERQAAAVVMAVDTGDILSLASVPSFDPNLFAAGISA